MAPIHFLFEAPSQDAVTELYILLLLSFVPFSKAKLISKMRCNEDRRGNNSICWGMECAVEDAVSFFLFFSQPPLSRHLWNVLDDNPIIPTSMRLMGTVVQLTSRVTVWERLSQPTKRYPIKEQEVWQWIKHFTCITNSGITGCT